MLTVAHRVENGGRGEDRVLVEHSGSRTLAIVADGAGGTGGGAAAAAMACSIAAQRLRTGGTGTAEDWARCLYEADQAVVQTGGQCTAVVVEISEGRVVGASVGDSGAWLLTGKAIVDLTENQHRKPLLGSDEALPMGFDCSWRENNVLKLLVPLVGGARESVRKLVIKTNVAFRRSSKVTKIDIKHAKAEAVPFLRAIIAVANPKLILLTGVKIDDFSSRYCDAQTPLGEPVVDDKIKQTVFAAARLTLPTKRDVLGVQIAHASQFSWTYDRYGVVERIDALRAVHA